MMRLPEGARPWLGVATGLGALAFGWAALVLPWRPEAPLGLLLWGIAALHLCTALTLALRPERASWPLKLLGALSLVAALVSTIAILVTSVQMVEMFGPLGWALAAALGAIGWLLLLATLPIASFALYCLRRSGSSHAAS